MRPKQLRRATKKAEARAETKMPQFEAAARSAIIACGELAAARFEEKATVHLTAAGEGPGWSPPEDDEMASLDEFIATLRGKTDPVRQAAVQDYFNAFGGAAGALRANWELTNPMISALLEKTGSHITNVAETTREAVRATMLKAYEAGLSVPDTAKAIQEAMSAASDARSVLIARTEFVGLTQGASVTAVQIVANATGDDYLKRWITAPGAEFPRHEEYADLDGQTVPLEGYFDVGGEELAYPGDPDGDPSEVCNCRCDLTYITPKEALEEEEGGGETAAGHPQVKLPSGGVMKPETNTGTQTANGSNPATLVAAPSTVRWEATLLVEGEPTDDGRLIDEGAIDWRELPLSLMAQISTDDGHDGAQVAGRIDRIWRDGNRIMGSGVFDSGEYGTEIARLVSEQMLRGLSVDLAVREYEFRPKDDDGEISEDDLMDILFGGADMLYVVTDGSIGAATVCAFPAFADAEISLVASSPLTWRTTRQHGMILVEAPASDDPSAEGEADEAIVVTASAAGLVPATPPAEWFEDPKLDGPTPLHITDDGRLFGHAAVWDVCHIGFEDACVLAPRSAAEYAYFLLGEVEVETDEGKATIPCGTITLGTGHAALRLTRDAAVEHYDDSGTQAARVAAGEDEHGIWIAGAIIGELSEERVAELRASKISGDWRNVNGNLELVAMLAVNVPGFPVPRVMVASADVDPMGWALVSAGVADQRVLDMMAERERVAKETADLAAEAIGTDELIAQARGAEVAADTAPFDRR